MPISPTNSTLMDLRLAYLRALALSWHEPAFRRELLESDDIQPLLRARFDLQWHWPSFAIRVVNNPDDPSHWHPCESVRWVGPNDRFIITLPRQPERERDRAEALATYYMMFPDLMGVGEIASDGRELPTALGVPGGGPRSLLDFGAVVLRAITLAWFDGAFYRQLTDPNRADATPILSKWLGYNSPFNFFMQFIGYDDTSPYGLIWQDRTWHYARRPGDRMIKPNAVALNYPNPPDDAKVFPIALASYNNTGEAYPFTCQ